MLIANDAPARLSGMRWMPATAARLGQASDAASEIETSVNGLAADLESLSAQLKLDSFLALDSARYLEVPVFGEGEHIALALTQTQVAKAVDMAAEGLSGLVAQTLTPPLGPYVTPASAALLEGAKDCLALVRDSMAVVLEFAPPGEDVSLLEAYSAEYVGAATELTRLIEEEVVTAESGTIPVYEEDEKGGGFWGVAAAAGILVGLIALGVYGTGQK